MPLPIIPKVDFPNVPDLPGVPRLPRSPRFPPLVQAVLGIVEGIIWDMLTDKPVWGIFDEDGAIVIQADSVLDFSYRGDARVSNFPVQDGTFASYNKVVNPYEAMIRLTKGGTEAERAEFLDTLEEIATGTDLYNVVTPERTYLSANVSMTGYRREANNGANLLIVDVMLTEIREVSPQYSKTEVQAAAQPSGTPPVNSGKVQPVPPTTSILKSIAGKLGF